MKRLLLFFIYASGILSLVYADIRTLEEAAAIAAGQLREAATSDLSKMPAARQEVKLFRTLYKTDLDLQTSLPAQQAAPQRRTHIDNDETEPALYMFNDDTDGFVVVSADTRATDILAYSLTGRLSDKELAPEFMWLMERFVEEISSLTGDDETMAAGLPARAPQSVTPIEPLLGTIKWGQNTPYNNQCPMDTYDNTRCVTGCVATAAAQIMRYWKWPVKGTGSHSYTWTNQNNSSIRTTLSLNFSSITFDWDNMLPSYKGDYTTAQANAVARLMYACGVSVDMNYGGNSTAGSGSVTDNMATAMTTYFGYQYVGNLGSSYNSIDNNSIYSGTTTYAQAYAEYFNDDLENGRPILMSGLSSGGGHAFVCDGRDADGYFHINWGWTGSSNCYTPLTAIRPGYPKHNDLYFKTRMYATYGLRPNTTCANIKSNTTASEAADNLPYVWRGQEITETGVYEDAETDEGGCTTTHVLYFTVRPAGTDGMCGDNLFYAYDASTHTLTITGTGNMWEYDYVSTPGRKTPWHSYASDIRAVVLPEGMTGISAFAFVYCSNLTAITIPSTITTIGAQPFFGCTSLTSIVWNAANCNTASARNLAPFYDVRSQITSFTFGDGVETIPGALCYQMANLTSCTLPAGVIDINIWAFSGCSGLTEIHLPGNVEYLGRQSFQNCTGLTSVTIPEKVELMMDSVFCGCTNLRSVRWNARACAINGTTAKFYPFYYIRSQITSFTIGNGVTSLPTGCCRSLTGLTSIVLPSSLTTIPSRCFQDCSSLATLTFEQVTPPTYASYAFSNVPAAAVVYVPCGTTEAYSASTLPFSDYRSHCGYCEENNGTNLEWDYTESTQSLTITGEGNMEAYADESDMPWYDVSDRIQAVSLTDEANQQPLLSWLADEDAKDVTLRRTLWADGYLNTLCLPFSLTAGEVQTFLPHAELYTFASARAVTGELLITLSSSSDITAGVPYLVRFPAEDDDIVNPTFTNVRVSATTGQTAGAGEVTFVGVLKPNDMIANNTNQLMVGTNDELFWADVNDYMKAYRAYFQINAASSSPIRKGMPARVVLEQQTPTDLTGAQQADSNRQCEKVIINGQLIIRTNGCEYNAQGQKR